MRVVFVSLVMFFPICLGFVKSSNAAVAAAGCGAVQDVLDQIPGALKTFRYAEDLKLRCSTSNGCRFYVRCKTFTLLRDLEVALESFCDMIEALEDSITSPITDALSGEFSSIEDALGEIGGAENITDPESLTSFIDDKMASIDGDMQDLFDLMPKLSLNNTGEWLRIGRIRRCRTNPDPDGGTEIGGTNYTDEPPTREQNNAENAVQAYSRAEERVLTLTSRRDRIIRDIAARELDLQSARVELDRLLGNFFLQGPILRQRAIIAQLRVDLLGLRGDLAEVRVALPAAIITRDNAERASERANRDLADSL